MNVRDFHNKAMEFAELALVARIQGQRAQAHEFFVQALEYELAAIAQLEVEGRIEPTNSVLHRSAGTLALDCNQPKKAEEIVKKALDQEPPQEIENELRELLHRIRCHNTSTTLTDENTWIDADFNPLIRTLKDDFNPLIRTLKEVA